MCYSRMAKRRRFDVMVCRRLDRLGRNLRHLVTLLEDLQAVGVSFVSLGEGIDCTTPAGRLQLHILAALSEFERGSASESGCWPAYSGPEHKVDDWVDRWPGRRSSGCSRSRDCLCLLRRNGLVYRGRP
jgi:Resolvase, N terminal domain